MGIEEYVGSGLIMLKCHGCKRPTLFKLKVWQKGDEKQYTSKRHCQSCEADFQDPLRRVESKSLAPALVEKQRIDAGCFEAEGGDGRGA